MDEITEFNAKFAQFADLQGTAAESLATDLALDPTQAMADMMGGVVPAAVSEYFAYVMSNASPIFTMTVEVWNRNFIKDAPIFTHTYADATEFLQGTYVDGTLAVPGFWAILPLRDGRFQSPNGGASGWSECFDDDTAETTIRTIDIFMAMTADNDGDGNLDAEVAVAKAILSWSLDDDDEWLLDSVKLIGDRVGYMSYGTYLVPTV